MRLLIVAVGRLKAGPERELCARYLDRASKSGRALGLSGPDVVEIAESAARRPEDRMADEGSSIVAALPEETAVLGLDPRGAAVSSEELAADIAALRDRGVRALSFLIGGADGLSDQARSRADQLIGFGRATFPHQLVRVMMAEQIYRVATILAGHPYHKG
ncbi:23S rRNA (pseudouridine(1915)-N(3))-methyltransferase RlmH [Ancylobacter mangrovi]|uniref:Ribosomal RNA large subunit methyltransferase H n=1 Tax=Ancylobacter mangrovi TaxID=2972472 RepID=A0A9X2T6Q2_9HYPH|nr:23S rRNA (pseudouridine(1915)-N(3))-methyltransferase RlmH [Ancylobacter mangrovi]MCS0495203.1 23S rRNA (pseudouridine(1915)-N(3))-methyltransferase RlmH [Ancylobacter mangrovi]MCS0502598.1 23S rRNA (pseudouridine(1915)-N(3))-methyltransferase RlmH [Ancylobacter mangrovi]